MPPHAERVHTMRGRISPAFQLATGCHLLAAHPSLPVRSVQQFIALAKARPGELNFASANI